MSMLHTLNVRPLRLEDIALLERWRRAYWDGDLELPKGWSAPGIETAVAEKNGVILGSLTATQAVVIDPLIRNPDSSHGPDIFAAIYMMERALAYQAQGGGAVDGYIAVPDHLKDYHKIVSRAGYTKTCEHCTIFRRPLRPDTQPLLGSARDELLARMRADSPSDVAEVVTPDV